MDLDNRIIHAVVTMRGIKQVEESLAGIKTGKDIVGYFNRRGMYRELT